jgi:nicotinamidase-related amidase
MTGSNSTAHTALLVMDVQRTIVDRYGEPQEFLDRLGGAIETARAADMMVIYVTIGFRDGFPEVSPRNKSFSALAGRGAFTQSTPDVNIHPAVAPQSGDVVVTKRRVGAFTGSDLEIVLRAREIDTLVLTGIATSGVVLSTVRAAADMDYRLVVLSDCCLDSDEEVHRVLTTKVFPRQTDVLTAKEWIEQVRATS